MFHHEGDIRPTLWALLAIVSWSAFLPAFVSSQELSPEIQIDKKGAFSGSQVFGLNESIISGYRVMRLPQMTRVDYPSADLGIGGADAFRTPPPFPNDFASRFFNPPIGPVWGSGRGNGDLYPTGAGFQFEGDRFWGLARGSQNSVTVLEGNSIELSVDAPSSVPVTITITSSDETKLSVSPAELKFTAANTTKTITLTAKQDPDIRDNQVTLTYTIKRGGDGTGIPDMDVTIMDDDHPITLTPREVDEGESVGISVYLLPRLGRPSGDVTFTVTGHEGTILSPTKTLTFPADSWANRQWLYLNAGHDDDRKDERLTLTLTASGGGFNGLKYTLEVTILDRTAAELLLPEDSEAAVDLRKVLWVQAYISGTSILVRPSSTVTGTWTGYEGTDVTVKTKTVTHTPDSFYPCWYPGDGWGYCSRVPLLELSAASDEDDVDDQVALTLQWSNPDDDGRPSMRVNVRVEDDDDPGLIVNPSELEIQEGGTGTFTVRLSEAPLGDLGNPSVTVRIPAVGDLSRSPSSLKFTGDNWDKPQTVTLTAGEDADIVNDQVDLWVTAQDGGFDRERGRVQVTILDNDRFEISVTPETVQVPEGGSATFAVSLSAQPSADVTVTIPSFTNPSLTHNRSGIPLTFTPSGATAWNVSQRVRITAAEDENTISERETLTLSASGGGYDDVEARVNVATVDNDVAGTGIKVTPALVTVPEGGENTFMVSLLVQPTADVTVTIPSPSVPGFRLGSSSLTFTPSGASAWNVVQPVTVFAAEDGNAVAERETLTLTASGGGYGSARARVTIVAQENDVANAEILVPASLSVVEGTSKLFGVGLSAEPLGTVTVTLVTNVAGLDLHPSSLTFTPSGPKTWAVQQEVRASAREDVDALDASGIITLRASSGGYEHAREKEVRVTVVDNDAVGIAAPATVRVVEGSPATFTVALSSAPSTTVTVSISGFTNSDMMRDPSSLTFTGLNYRTPQTVTVSAQKDENADSESEILTLTARGGEYDKMQTQVMVQVQDLDHKGIVVPRLVEVAEGGSETLQVRLASQPSGPVRIRIHSSIDDLKLDPSNLQFTRATWNHQMSVTLSAPQDRDVNDESGTLTLAAAGGGYDGVEQDVAIEIRDDGVAEAGSIIINPSVVPVEEGRSAVFEVSLSTRPTVEEVAVTVPGFINPDLTHDREGASLAFTVQNYSSPQLVTVSAARDATLDDESETIVLTATGGNYDEVERDVMIQVSDVDVEEGRITANPSRVTIEEGSSGTFAVSLSVEPTANVSLTIPGFINPDLTHDREGVSLAFTAQNYHLPQLVTVWAARDATFDDESETIVLTATGGNYDEVERDVTIQVSDLDVARIEAIPTSVVVTEGGEATFAVSLSAEPPDPVTVSVDWGEGSDLELLSAPVLMFSPSDWKDPQTVTLTAAQDATADDEESTVTLSAPGWTPATVQVRIEDDDTAGIVATPGVVEVPEGQTEQFTVSLTAQPLRTVTVSVRGHENTDLTLLRNQLIFTTRNWQVPQPVTLHAENDSDYEDEAVTLTLTASGGGYAGVPPAVVEVTIVDKGPLTISIYDQSVGEGKESIQLRVALNRAAERVVTVLYQNVDHGGAEAGQDYTASRGIVIFDPGATEGVVQFEVMEDEIQEEEETFAVTLSGARGALIARGTATATIVDNDRAASLAIRDAVVDGDARTVTFQVQLSHPSLRPVSVRYRTADGTATAGEDYADTAGILTFAPGTMETTIAVSLLGQAVDWREETFFVHLTSAESAEIEKAVATGTIREATPEVQKALSAYAARFVRTSSTHLVEALQERLQPQSSFCSALQRAEMARLWVPASSWRPSLGELLSGCRVSRSRTGSAGHLGVWGRGAFRQFHGLDEEALTLRGTVATGMLGADYRARAGWLVGLMLAHSRGDGSFKGSRDSGDLQSQLTGIYPYVSYVRAEWEMWLSGGYGRGEAEAKDLEGNLTSRFGALGVQGNLTSVDRVRFRYHADVLLTDAEVEAHAIRAEVSRVRFGIQGALQTRGGIRPYVEANVRRDGGSAETGMGVELGGGIRMAYPAWRLRADLRSQGLVLHSADGFREWGISGSLQLGDPSNGLMVSVRPSWGPSQGISLYRQQTILNATPLRTDMYRTELELGYGTALGDGRMRSIIAMTQLPNRTLLRVGGELRPRNWMALSIVGLTHYHRSALGNISLSVQGSLRY